MLHVSVVFPADVLNKFTLQRHGVRCERRGLRVRARVVDGVPDFEMSRIRTAKALSHDHLVGVNVAVLIEPRDRILPRSLDHQGAVAFPMPDRISPPGFDDIGIVTAPIQSLRRT